MKEVDEDFVRLDRILAQLSEHYDSVQIVATRHTGDKTIRVDRGTGNWFSRYGAVQLWVEKHLGLEWGQDDEKDDNDD